MRLVNDLTATHKDVGLIINFGERKVEVKRKESFPKIHQKNNHDQQDKYNPVNPVYPVKK